MHWITGPESYSAAAGKPARPIATRQTSAHLPEIAGDFATSFQLFAPECHESEMRGCMSPAPPLVGSLKLLEGIRQASGPHGSVAWSESGVQPSFCPFHGGSHLPDQPPRSSRDPQFSRCSVLDRSLWMQECAIQVPVSAARRTSAPLLPALRRGPPLQRGLPSRHSGAFPEQCAATTA